MHGEAERDGVKVKGACMTFFLAERELPNSSPDKIQMQLRVVVSHCQDLTAQGKPVHYVGSIYLPGDARVLSLFEASEAGDVRDVNEAAQLPFTRIVAAFQLVP